MSRHRSRHRSRRRTSALRYPRVAMAGVAAAVTAVALLGASGLMPAGGAGESAYAAAGPAAAPAPGTVRSEPLPTAGALPPYRVHAQSVLAPPAVPAGSGHGRRVVFDMSAQRVWMVADGGAVRRTYPVSGSVTDNLGPGRYAVYSRSRHATGIDDSGTMQYMVRFTRGVRAAIGFHDIPVKDGERVQSRAELGTPLSHGCIRQWRPDARALWRFAPVGTRVVVVR